MASLDLPHDALDLIRIRSARVVGKQLLAQVLTLVVKALRQLPRHKIDPRLNGRKTPPSRMIAPAIVLRRTDPAECLADRDRGKQTVIQTISVGGAQVLGSVARLRAIVKLEETIEP